jgi:hypothetical protein
MNVHVVYSILNHRDRDASIEGVCKTKELAEELVANLEKWTNYDGVKYFFHIEEHPVKEE